MSKFTLLFFFIFLFFAGQTFTQSNAIPIVKIKYEDSTLYYFQKCKAGEGIDTATFWKAVAMLEMTDFNNRSLQSVQSLAVEFRNRNHLWLAERVEEEIAYTLCNSDSLELAIEYCTGLLERYDAGRNPDYRYVALFSLLEMRKPLRSKSIPEAFDFYSARIKTYIENNDSSGLAISYFCIGTTYRLVGLPDMTIYNIKKSIAYINKYDTLTSLPISGLGGWMNNTSVLGQLYLEVGDYESAILYSKSARSVRLRILKEENVSFLNENIAYAKLMLNKLDGVQELLNSAIQLAIEFDDYPSLVRAYEIKGQYFLAIQQLDSAEASLLKCKEVMQLHKLSYFSAAGSHTPDYYLAKVRMLQNRYVEARSLLEQEIVLIANTKSELLKEQKLLIEVYNKLGDNEAAGAMFKQYLDLQAVLAAEERKNRTKSYEVEVKISDAENTIHDLTTEKKIAEITKKYLIGIAVLLLLVVAVIFNRFMLTRKQKLIIEKEKKRSDELLLNILPEEVAEELKAKGSADARQFDDVTVMFTDFKGFTQIAEKLSPGELVNEIHSCFKAFDDIVSKYGIEKIKTIGDSYMCAGGLPLSNETHAVDVVKAAMDIQEFMRQHLQERREQGKLPFEIRIGIHTGAVVAGIVGVKKFAYDIWGDTVNIASRMESSGEAGKINISGSTFEKVKDNFHCVHRGKITAKGKGEIDMYFVEAVL